MASPSPFSSREGDEEDEFERGKYIPLCTVYSATAPSGSKMVKPPPPAAHHHHQLKHCPAITVKSRATHVYARRRKRRKQDHKPSFFDSLVLQGGLPLIKSGVDGEAGLQTAIKRRRMELDDHINSKNVRKFHGVVNNGDTKYDSLQNDLNSSGVVSTNTWSWLSFEGFDPKKFIGLRCKVHWPLDASWYHGHVVGYNLETGRHRVKYEDEEEEDLILSNERIKFHVSFKEMQKLKLEFREKSSEADGIDVKEMMALAATLDDCQEIDTGDIIWAKLTEDREMLNRSLPAVVNQLPFSCNRLARKQVFSFLTGLFTSCHLKCKKPTFLRGLEEAKMYLSEQRLPKRMLHLRDGIEADTNSSGNGDHEDGADSGVEECTIHNETRRKLEDLKSFSFEAGELQIISLGKIAKDTGNFHNERFIWPEGYTAVRMFPSIIDPSVHTLYKMEVLRDADLRTRPLFRVTTDNEEEFDGPSPSACWNKIYKRIRTLQIRNPDHKADQNFASGSYMFGFSHPEISKLIKEMLNSRSSSKSSKLAFSRPKGLPVGFRPVHIEWRDLDKCNVCHMDEEYENNLLLQCDKCRMMVHARCYGELEPTGGVLWLCNLCRPEAPESPPCCLCPVIGGAMKPTTDGRWAHLACAIWIPETCLTDTKKMEPIDGLHRINKDRWKLLCSICGVAHGACIQCSNNNCRVSYHPLCARAAGFCPEPEDIDRMQLVHFDEDEEDQCIRLLSFCRKHRPSSTERLYFEERIGQNACERAECIPQPNPSGSARTEPYNFLKRRGRKEPEVLAAVSSKRLYVENKPYLVGGCSPHMPLWSKMCSNEPGGSKYSVCLEKIQTSQLDPSSKILSLADKYDYMRDTFRKRLTFGKSGIHGFGVFTKLPHRAGDMVIEYTGELIRAPVADRREHLIYNSLVGAGTYMFRIDDERVIDATRAGSIAHLINHSCEPNCYSRVISIDGDDHIIIFAKRDIKQWEELTYDYRFVSSDERLACYCGFSRCRGIVNDIEAEERVAKLYVPQAELDDWQGE
ncbi:hypothetical protein BUALT_Bualt09G0015600 [Buddleja alternifolia]|uniref:Histone-lysine N-methyltransferase ATX2 n=1 Tax=Buddleja alternifolia TaxID=168488 RepID=A0AAV6WZP4_9LAMI|nr:hypothetical protein BUALT_Bualt09G0015600 [Buddleja alternifolia]